MTRAARLRAALWFVACLATGALWLEGVLHKDEPLYLAWAVLGALAAAPARWPRAERPARRLLVMVVMGALGVAATDLAARGVVQLSYRPDDAFARKYPALPDLGRFIAGAHFDGEVHGDLGAMVPDVALRVRRRVRFTTDDRGFRNDPAVAGGPHDVVVLGDSFAFGSGTTQDETWVQRLRTQHGRAAYTLGFPGSPWHGCVNGAIELPDLPVREGGVLLLMLFAGNDLDDVSGASFDPVALGWPAPWWRQAGVMLESWRTRSPFNLLRLRRKARPTTKSPVLVGRTRERLTFLFYRPYVEAAGRTRAQVREHPGFAPLATAIQTVRGLAASRGLRPVVVVAPAKAEVHPEELAAQGPAISGGAFAAEVADRCRVEGVPCLDLLPAMRDRARTPGADPLYWPDDTHWSPAGHALAAEAIAAFLDATSRRSE